MIRKALCHLTSHWIQTDDQSLVGSNQSNYFENATACNKRTLKTRVAMQLVKNRFQFTWNTFINFTLKFGPKSMTGIKLFSRAEDVCRKMLLWNCEVRVWRIYCDYSDVIAGWNKASMARFVCREDVDEKWVITGPGSRKKGNQG